MQITDVIIIGAGQAGLAVSHGLNRRGIDHVLLERGRVAERWRSSSWDSLHLLTPNWQSRLPGFAYTGPEPDNFMSMPELVDFLERYAAVSCAPIQAQTRVLGVSQHFAGFRVRTDRADLYAREVVLATGYCEVPRRPALAQHLSRRVEQLSSSDYRNPDCLPPGGVLVVGAAASGVQIADELARSGRAVTLAVGSHTRLPRRYRGADIMRWLDRIGALDETPAAVRDLERARAQPSLQLIGSDPPRDLDLLTLHERGVRLCGRLSAASGSQVSFAHDLPSSMQAAEHRLSRLLDRIDRVATGLGEPRRPPQLVPERFAHAARTLDLRAEGISSVLWASGFGRDYSWLQVPVLDARGEIIQTRGLTPVEGLYTMGLRLQGTRKSTFIDGVAADAEYVTRQIAARLGCRESAAA